MARIREPNKRLKFTNFQIFNFDLSRLIIHLDKSTYSIAAYVVISICAGMFIGTLFWRVYWVKRHLKRFEKRSKAVISGLVKEQMAPFLPHFPYHPTEVKFLGKPIDFIVFKGLDQNEVKEIIFLEIKSNRKISLPAVEKSIEKCIREKNIRWERLNIES